MLCCSICQSVVGSEAHETPPPPKKNETTKVKSHSSSSSSSCFSRQETRRLRLSLPSSVSRCDGRTLLHHEVVVAHVILLCCWTWKTGENGQNFSPPAVISGEVWWWRCLKWVEWILNSQQWLFLSGCWEVRAQSRKQPIQSSVTQTASAESLYFQAWERQRGWAKVGMDQTIWWFINTLSQSHQAVRNSNNRSHFM